MAEGRKHKIEQTQCINFPCIIQEGFVKRVLHGFKMKTSQSEESTLMD